MNAPLLGNWMTFYPKIEKIGKEESNKQVNELIYFWCRYFFDYQPHTFLLFSCYTCHGNKMVGWPVYEVKKSWNKGEKKLITYWTNIESSILLHKQTTHPKHTGPEFIFNYHKNTEFLLCVKFDWLKGMSINGLFYIWTELLSIFLADLPTWGISFEPKLHHGGGFFGPRPLLILKSSHQDLSIEGANFILSPLEVGHWVNRRIG